MENNLIGIDILDNMNNQINPNESTDIEEEVEKETPKEEDKKNSATNVNPSLDHSQSIQLETANNIFSSDTDIIDDVEEVQVVEETLTAKAKKQIEYVSEIEEGDPIYELFGGNSSYNLATKENADTSSVLGLLNSFKKMGQYIDLYLPMSNVAVRMFEFDNDIMLPDILPPLLEDDNISQLLLGREVTHDRLLLRKIFENTEIISKGNNVANAFDLENLSNLDMNLLILGAAKLILLSDSAIPDKSKVYLSEGGIYCKKCGRTMKVEINLDDLIKAQYKKNQVELAKQAYNPDASWEDNFKNSPHELSKRKGAKYTKDGINEILVMCKDPSYAESINRETAAFRYLVRTYEQFPIVEELIDNTEYKGASIKNKLSILVQAIGESQSSARYASQINTDMIILNYIMYSDMIAIRTITGKDTNGRNKYEFKQKDLINTTPMETLFETFKALPKEIKDKLDTIVKEFHEKAIENKLNYKFNCPYEDCKEENELDLDSRALVFTTAQTRLGYQEQNTSQN